MLVLSRKVDEEIVIAGGEIKITVLSIRGDKVRIGIEADNDIPIHRGEVHEAILAQEAKAKKLKEGETAAQKVS